MTADLTSLLAQGKTYLWALRQSQLPGMDAKIAGGIKEAFAKEGVDLFSLMALKHLEYPMARFPHPSWGRARFDEFYFFPIPAFDIEIYFKTTICEHGLELGMELFPKKVDWQFGHDEIQYCIGGDTMFDMIFPNNSERSLRVRTGDVIAWPGGTNYIAHASEEEGKFGHAHIFLTNLSEKEGQIFYDVGGLLRLQSLGILDPPPGQEALPFSDISDRIEEKKFSKLLDVFQDRDRDLPTWLRNGWKQREATRALDYAEGTKSVVMSSPDRSPENFMEWGTGNRKCYINPLIAENTAGITDCRFPSGYKRLHLNKELWTVLKGKAKIKQSIPPLHSEWVEMDLEENCVMVASNGAHINVLEATDDFVVRRLVETCAHNCFAEMMECKLELAGVPNNI